MPRKTDDRSSELRVSTIIKQRKIRPHLAAAVMVQHNLKASDRIEPEKFVEMVETWRKQPVGGK